MSDPIARADQAVEEIKGTARVHGAYFMQLLEVGLERDEALASMHTLMWTTAGNHDCDDDECGCS